VSGVSADPSLADAVIATISGDPRITHPSEIAVSAVGGMVTLRGTVDSFPQRRAAAEDARKTVGVYDVEDELEVDPLGGHRHEDHEIRGAALQTLMWDVQVPSDFVEVKVKKGWVTLTGDVDYDYQRTAAFEDVAHLSGVVDVTNDIKVRAEREA
jgi:osmotically-inducible protein OsmY